MAGTLRHAGAQIARQATAAGLAGLAVALLVGVLAFAFATTPSEGARAATPTLSDTAIAYLTNTLRGAELRTLSATRPLETPAAEQTEVSVVPVNEQALLASREEAQQADGPRGQDGLDAQGGVATAAVEDIATPPATPAPTVAAASTARPAAAALAVGDQVRATISFYYCERGPLGLHPGDGGHFCGTMRDGSVVYPGAAACSYIYLGQHFRIEGDPLDRVYTCADTGSAVHGLHRDIWFMDSDQGWTWQLQVGQSAVIEIVE